MRVRVCYAFFRSLFEYRRFGVTRPSCSYVVVWIVGPTQRQRQSSASLHLRRFKVAVTYCACLVSALVSALWPLALYAHVSVSFADNNVDTFLIADGLSPLPQLFDFGTEAGGRLLCAPEWPSRRPANGHS